MENFSIWRKYKKKLRKLLFEINLHKLSYQIDWSAKTNKLKSTTKSATSSTKDNIEQPLLCPHCFSQVGKGHHHNCSTTQGWIYKFQVIWQFTCPYIWLYRKFDPLKAAFQTPLFKVCIEFINIVTVPREGPCITLSL